MSGTLTFSLFLSRGRPGETGGVDKKTINVSAKVSERTHAAATDALGRTGTRTMSRFIQGCIDDLIRKYERGVKIEEPIRLMSQEEGRILEGRVGKERPGGNGQKKA